MFIYLLDLQVIGDARKMTRPYLHFRPTQEILEEIDSISLATGLTLADVTRQLCLKGLDVYRLGLFEFRMPGNSAKKGEPDGRYLRQCGILIREKKKGGTPSNVGDTRNASSALAGSVSRD